MQPINAICPSCSRAFTGTPKRTFLGFQALVCPACNTKMTYPLTSGYRTAYWVLCALMAMAILNTVARGEVGGPGVLGILVIIALVRDGRIQRQVAARTARQSPDQT